MSSRNGDKARFHRQRKRKLARREISRAVRKNSPAQISQAPKSDSP